MSGRGIQVHQDSSRKLPGVVREDPEFFGHEIDISREKIHGGGKPTNHMNY